MHVVRHLRASGHDVLAVAEIMPYAQDNEILAVALEQTRVLITNDRDFGELVFRSEMGHVGIVLLRLQDENSERRVSIMDTLLQHYSDRLPGNFVVATDDRVRIRRGDWSSA